MNATSTAGTQAGQAPAAQSAPVGSGITRLNPFDGLFLRAEHLERIQSYARELTRALGQAGGPGVAYGYDLSVSGSTLHVGSGLAIAPDGRPLLLTVPYSRTLDELASAADGQWWVVELILVEQPFGDESVYGVLCDDPCADGTSSRPFVAEVVQVRLRQRSLAFTDTDLSHRRSVVASAWFEAERLAAGSLLRTSDRDRAAPSDFSAASWTAPTGPPDGQAVAIGVLLRLAGAWQVDTWTARRDRIEPPPDRTWRGRLGMRPWSVFLAQVLQFQVQLAEAWPTPAASAALAQLANIPHVMSEVQEAVKGLEHRQLTVPRERLVSALALLSGEVTGQSKKGRLVDAGIVELPPAGLLPLSGLADLQTEVADMLGPRVTPQFCACRPDFVGHAVEQAQHMDRIPLTDPKVVSLVDVLVPDGTRASGAQGGLTTAHNWVAFHRRRDLDCGETVAVEPTDKVDVIRVDAGNDTERNTTVDKIVKGQQTIGESDHVEATYPAGRWALPAPEVQQKVQTWTSSAGSVTVVGLAGTSERRPLADARGGLLISPFDQSSPTITRRTAVMAVQGKEQIWVVVVPPQIN
ncbi:MAG TPA: hypothetical protein VGM21_13510 [Actinomycetota bacterium]|jgi:hypothetical protein